MPTNYTFINLETTYKLSFYTITPIFSVIFSPKIMIPYLPFIFVNMYLISKPSLLSDAYPNSRRSVK